MVRKGNRGAPDYLCSAVSPTPRKSGRVDHFVNFDRARDFVVPATVLKTVNFTVRSYDAPNLSFRSKPIRGRPAGLYDPGTASPALFLSNVPYKFRNIGCNSCRACEMKFIVGEVIKSAIHLHEEGTGGRAVLPEIRARVLYKLFVSKVVWEQKG